MTTDVRIAVGGSRSSTRRFPLRRTLLQFVRTAAAEISHGSSRASPCSSPKIHDLTTCPTQARLATSMRTIREARPAGPEDGRLVGQDMGDDFNEMIDRMEAGEMPDDDGDSGGGDFGGGFDDD